MSESQEGQEVKPFKSFTQEEWESYEANVAREKEEVSNKSYTTGKDVGRKHFIRDSKDTLGIDFEGNDGDTFIKAIQEKAISDAGIQVDEKVKSLKSDLETLRSNQSSEIEKYKSEVDSYKNKYTSLINDQEISRHIPDKLKGVSKRDAMTIIKNDLEFTSDEDGNRVVKKAGEIVKDKSLSPIPWETAIKDALLERDWLSSGDGRGEQKKGIKTTGFSKMSEMNEYFEREGINPKSQEAMAMIQKAGKENKDFDFVN